MIPPSVVSASSWASIFAFSHFTYTRFTSYFVLTFAPYLLPYLYPLALSPTRATRLEFFEIFSVVVCL